MSEARFPTTGLREMPSFARIGGTSVAAEWESTQRHLEAAEAALDKEDGHESN